MIRPIIILLFSFFALLPDINAQAQQPKASHYAFSIQQALDFAKANNIQVKNALLAVQAQKETNREITASALPSFSGNANLTNYLELPVSLLPGEIFGQPPGSYIPVRFGTKYNSTVGLQLQQTIFDGQVFKIGRAHV